MVRRGKDPMQFPEPDYAAGNEDRRSTMQSLLVMYVTFLIRSGAAGVSKQTTPKTLETLKP